MSLIKRTKKLKPEVAEDELVEATPEDLIGMLRTKIHEVVRDGMQSHEAAQSRLDLVAILDELDLTLRPQKKE